MAVKAKDLARMLGVSTATVSLVLNNKPGVCEQTRKQLTERILEMGYGYMLAQPPEEPLRKKPFAYVIYSHCEHINRPIPAQSVILQGAEAAAREVGYDLVIRYLNPVDGDSILECITQDRYAGCIIQKPCLHRAEYEELEKLRIPYVMVGAYHAGANCVTSNNEQGIREVLRYLREKGHTRIAYVRSEADPAAYIERRQCFDGRILSLEELKAAAPGSAIIAEDDEIAAAVLRVLSDRGLRVPEDVSVIGFGDTEVCEMVTPSLTSVHESDYRMGWEAVQILISAMKLHALGQEPEKVQLEVSVSLTERDSVKAV